MIVHKQHRNLPRHRCASFLEQAVWPLLDELRETTLAPSFARSKMREGEEIIEALRCTEP
jgi:hypothetical protein